MQHIGTLTQLRELNLTLTPVKDNALKHIGGLTNGQTYTFTVYLTRSKSESLRWAGAAMDREAPPFAGTR